MIRSVKLCMLEAVEGRLCLLEVLEALEMTRRVLLWMLDVLDVMRCMRLRMLDAVEGGLSFGVSKFLLSQFSRYSPPPSRWEGKGEMKEGSGRGKVEV